MMYHTLVMTRACCAWCAKRKHNSFSTISSTLIHQCYSPQGANVGKDQATSIDTMSFEIMLICSLTPYQTCIDKLLPICVMLRGWKEHYKSTTWTKELVDLGPLQAPPCPRILAMKRYSVVIFKNKIPLCLALIYNSWFQITFSKTYHHLTRTSVQQSPWGHSL